MTLKIRESNAKVASSAGNGIFEVKIINEGWGSSGYYSKELLQEYGTKTFRKNRPSFANHPTQEEFENGRDITKLMGKFVEDAEYREDAEGKGALYGKLKARPEWIDFIEEYKDVIGMSIFAQGEASEGEAEGRTGMLVESFDHEDPYVSVDFVVAAGRGGKVERMVESARQVIEMTANDKREKLQAVIKDNAGDGYSWVRDFDDAVVYVEMNDGLYQIEYSTNESGSIVLGDRTEVRATTKYVPVSENVRASDSENPEKKESKMAFEDEITAKVEALAESVTALAESLKPADEETTEVDRAAVVEAALEAGLSKSARDRVLKAVEAGETPDDAIASEKALKEEYVKEFEAASTDGGFRTRESASGGSGDFDPTSLKF